MAEAAGGRLASLEVGGFMSLERFAKLWTSSSYPPDPVMEADIRVVEQRFDFMFPNDYCQEVLQVGLPRPNIALLDAIVDRELDLRDVSDFLNPSDIVSVTDDWRDLGLPENLVAFATDCMGNLFCFPTANDGAEAVSVFFFDHDDKTVDLVAHSFNHSIDGFCGVVPH